MSEIIASKKSLKINVRTDKKISRYYVVTMLYMNVFFSNRLQKFQIKIIQLVITIKVFLKTLPKILSLHDNNFIRCSNNNTNALFS